MLISSGIFNHCVLQRNQDNLCRVSIKGYLNRSGNLIVAAADNMGNGISIDDPVIKIYAENIPKEDEYFSAYRYKFDAVLSGIPAGGPYTITFCQDDNQLTFEDVLVGDVYLLAGQSNMEGVGRMEAKAMPLDKVRAFYMNDVWDVAEDPVHKLEDAIDQVHRQICGGAIEAKNPSIGVGPGVAFGQKLYEMTGVPQGLIACAHGGTSMDQWSPDCKDLSGSTLYSALLRRFNKNGSNVKGLFWYQGCNDADEESADAYYDKMINFINSIREDTSQHDLPVVAVQIARQCAHDANAEYWNTVQHSQYMLEAGLHKVSVVPAVDLEMDDFIHISGASQNRLGIRSAKAMLYLNDKDYAYKPSIRLQNIEVRDCEDSWNCKVILTFNNVLGRLESKDRPSGFTITNRSKADGCYVYHTQLNDCQVILHTTETSIDINNCFVNYGKGLMPYCNITDSEDRSLPVMCKIPIGRYRNLSAPCTLAWLGESMMDNLYFDSKKALIEKLNMHFERKDFGYYYLNIYNQFNHERVQRENRMVYYVPFAIDKGACVQLLLGGLGNMGIYCDGEIIDNVSLDTEKIHPDQTAIPFYVDAGVHILAIDYLCLSDKTCGVFIRFENTKKAVLPYWFLE